MSPMHISKHLLLAALFCALGALPALADQDPGGPKPEADPPGPLVERVGGRTWQGDIRWDKGLIQVQAMARTDPSRMGGRARAELAALKFARYRAFQRLLEVTRGVRLDDGGVLGDRLALYRDRGGVLQGAVRGARVEREEARVLPDGRVLGIVRLSLPLRGSKGLSGMAIAAAPRIMETPDTVHIMPRKKEMLKEPAPPEKKAPAVKAVPAPVAKPETKPAVVAEPKQKSEPKKSAEPKKEIKAEPEKTEAGAKVTAKPKAKAVAKPKPKAEAKPKELPKAKAKTEAKPKAVPKPVVKVAPKPKPAAKKAEPAKKIPAKKSPAKPKPEPSILVKDGRNFVPVKSAYAKYNSKDKYTGLIVTASGLGAKPAMFPLVLDSPSGLEVFGPNHVGKKYAIEKGVVGYAPSVQKAMGHERVGNNPLVVKAVKVKGLNKAKLVVSRDDALKIYAADRTGGFLKKCGVVIVIN